MKDHTMGAKVLIVATKERGAYCINALKKMGYECAYFQFRDGLVYNNPHVRKLIRRFPKLKFIKRRAVANINNNLLKIVEKYKPDYLIATVAENIRPETILKINASGVKTANWFTDFFRHWHIIERLAPAYQSFFSSDGNTLRKLQELGLENCHYLPEAVENPFHDSPFTNRNNKYPVTFIGSYNPDVWQHREKFLSTIKDLGLNIWGPKAWLNTSLKDYYRGTAHGKDMLQIYRESKIVIDIPWDDKIAEGIGARPFEAMSSGACFLTYDVRKDMRRIFKLKEDYIHFANEDELRKEVRFYLEHEEERGRIARTAYDKVTSNHSYIARIETIIKTL